MKMLPPLLLSLVVASSLGAADEKKGQPSVAKPPAGSAAAGAGGGGTAPVRLSPEPDRSVPAPVLLNDRVPKATKGAARPPSSTLPELRARWTREGQAALVVDGMEQAVRAGSWIGAMEVKSLAPGRMVLKKPAAPGEPGGEALVIVTFDASGQGRAVTLYTKDPRPAAAPEVHK